MVVLTPYVLRMNGNDCINMLLVIDTLRRAASQVFFPLLPAAELETSPSVSRLMNAAARSASSLMSPQHVIASRKCTIEQRCVFRGRFATKDADDLDD